MARALLTRGEKVFFLTRGYGGRLKGPLLADPAHHNASDIGDEPLLLARIAPTIVARDRAAGAALADRNGASVIIMDDGFQNFRLKKDFSVLVINGTSGFGNGRVIPAGPLREPAAQGFARADAAIMLGEEGAQLPYSGPILRARVMAENRDALKGKRIHAFAGIANPERFFAMLRGIGAEITGTSIFADHYAFQDRDIKTLQDNARRQDAVLVTTEKDFVRLAPAKRERIIAVAIHAVFENAAAFAALLDKALASGDGAHS